MSKGLPAMYDETSNISESLNKEARLNADLKAGNQGLPNYLPEKEKSYNYQELKEKDAYLDKPYEDIESFMFNPELTKEYERIKDSYKDLINMFEASLEKNVYSNEKSDKIKNNTFENLADFDDAVSKGEVNINNYSIKEINQLMQELEKLEENVNNRDLEDYQFKTIRDFHQAVDNGVINLDKYNIKDINKLLENLEDDKKLKLSDYDISLFGNITIGEIHIKIENNNYNMKDYSKLSKLGNLPGSDIYEDIVGKEIRPNEKMKNKNKDEPKQIYTEDDYDLDKTFIDRISDFIKRLFNKKKDP